MLEWHKEIVKQFQKSFGISAILTGGGGKGRYLALDVLPQRRVVAHPVGGLLRHLAAARAGEAAQTPHVDDGVRRGGAGRQPHQRHCQWRLAMHWPLHC